MEVVFRRRRSKKVAFASFLAWNLPFSSRHCLSLRWTWVPPNARLRRETFFGSSLSTQAWSKVAFASFLGLTSRLWRLASSCDRRVYFLSNSFPSLEEELFMKFCFGECAIVFPWIVVVQSSSFCTWAQVFEIFVQFSSISSQFGRHMSVLSVNTQKLHLSATLVSKTNKKYEDSREHFFVHTPFCCSFKFLWFRFTFILGPTQEKGKTKAKKLEGTTKQNLKKEIENNFEAWLLHTSIC